MSYPVSNIYILTTNDDREYTVGGRTEAEAQQTAASMLHTEEDFKSFAPYSGKGHPKDDLFAPVYLGHAR